MYIDYNINIPIKSIGYSWTPSTYYFVQFRIQVKVYIMPFGALSIPAYVP